jgi:hypothetical protein
VINLAAGKTIVLREAARVRRRGAHLAVSDEIADPNLDQAARDEIAAPTAGCVAGEVTEAEFRDALADAGLHDVEIREAPGVVAAYNARIDERVAMFETRPRTVSDLTDWLTDGQPFIVAERAGRVVGFARAGACSDRCPTAALASTQSTSRPTREGSDSGANCSTNWPRSASDAASTAII